MRFVAFSFAITFSTAPFAECQEGGIEVFAAETLFDQGTRVSVSHILKRRGSLFQGSDSINDPLGQKLTEQRTVVSIDHGLRADLTLSALIPFVDKSFDQGTSSVSSSGLGDVALLVKYRAYKRDWPRGAHHLSLIGGAELPTGETRARDAGLLLAPGLQPGQGAVNPFFGISYNRNESRFRMDALALVKLNQEGEQDFQKGNFVALEIDAAYRFLHNKYPGPTASAKIGLQWRHEGRADVAGASEPNSGSEEVLLRPGVTWHPAPQIDVTFSVDVPLHQDFNGTQLAQEFRSFFAFGIRF